MKQLRKPLINRKKIYFLNATYQTVVNLDFKCKFLNYYFCINLQLNLKIALELIKIYKSSKHQRLKYFENIVVYLNIQNKMTN